MHFELQCLIYCPAGKSDCPDVLREAAEALEAKLRTTGVGFVIEARDIRAGKRLYRGIEGKDI